MPFTDTYHERFSNLVHATFINGTFVQKLKCNGKSTRNKVGVACPSPCHYVNGHVVKTTPFFRKGHTGERLLTWVVYTARGGSVDVEMKVRLLLMNDNTYHVIGMTGFDGVDLLDTPDPETYEYLLPYLYATRGEHDKAAEVDEEARAQRKPKTPEDFARIFTSINMK